MDLGFGPDWQFLCSSEEQSALMYVIEMDLNQFLGDGNTLHVGIVQTQWELVQPGPCLVSIVEPVLWPLENQNNQHPSHFAVPGISG